MTIAQILDLLFKIVDLIDYEWNLHLLVTIAIAGWLISLKRNPAWQLKLLITVGIVAFNMQSIYSLLDYYRTLDIALVELKAHVTEATFKTSDVLAFIKNLDTGKYVWLVFLVHIPVGVLLLIGLWMDRLWKHLRDPEDMSR